MVRHSLPILSFSLALGLFAAGPARAETLTFQDGAPLPSSAAYAGTQDTEISQSSPTQSYGSKVSLRTDLESFGGETQALVRFDSIFGALPDRIPPGSTITSATLTCDVFNSSNVPVGVVSVYRMTTPWNESSSWNALADGVQAGTDTVASADDAHTVEAIATTSFDVLPSLQAWSAGARNAGWVLVNDSTDGVECWSSEDTTPSRRPSLTVVFTPPAATPAVPALSRGGLALLLAALALAGSARAWRRERG